MDLRRTLLRAAFAFALAATTATASAQDSLEFPVKAAFLTKFGGFVEWPASAFASTAAPLVLCVLGDDPFGPAIDRAASAQPVSGHPIAVRRLKAVRGDSGCHILYIAPSEAARAQQAIDAVRGTPVLTVTDARPGGAPAIISFVIREERVRFDIDDEAAMHNGLVISSKLLGLALSVKPRRGTR